MQSDEILRAELEKVVAECEHLRQENARLRLRIGGTPKIRDSRLGRPPSSDDEKPQQSATVTADSRPEVKVSLFRSLFRGRDDVYALTWEGRVVGASLCGRPVWPNDEPRYNPASTQKPHVRIELRSCHISRRNRVHGYVVQVLLKISNYVERHGEGPRT